MRRWAIGNLPAAQKQTEASLRLKPCHKQMARDYYPFNSIPELLVLRKQVQDRQTNGGITELTVGGGNGVHTKREFRGYQNPLSELDRIDYSLWKRAQDSGDEALIELYPHPGKQKITCVKPNYQGFAHS